MINHLFLEDKIQSLSFSSLWCEKYKTQVQNIKLSQLLKAGITELQCDKLAFLLRPLKDERLKFFF